MLNYFELFVAAGLQALGEVLLALEQQVLDLVLGHLAASTLYYVIS